MADEAVDVEQSPVLHGQLRIRAAHDATSVSAGSFRWQRASWPTTGSRRPGRSVAARLERRVAPGPEGTADDLVVETRWRARDRDHLVVTEEIGRRREEHSRVGVARVVVDRGHPPHLDDLARVHHRRAITHLRDDRQVVRDEDHRQPELLPERRAQADEQLEDLRLHHHVEGGRRLVGKEHLRRARERHRDRGPLPHAAGELVRVAIGAIAGDPDELEQLGDARARALPRRQPVQHHRLGDLRADRS